MYAVAHTRYPFWGITGASRPLKRAPPRASLESEVARGRASRPTSGITAPTSGIIAPHRVHTNAHTDTLTCALARTATDAQPRRRTGPHARLGAHPCARVRALAAPPHSHALKSEVSLMPALGRLAPVPPLVYRISNSVTASPLHHQPQVGHITGARPVPRWGITGV